MTGDNALTNQHREYSRRILVSYQAVEGNMHKSVPVAANNADLPVELVKIVCSYLNTRSVYRWMCTEKLISQYITSFHATLWESLTIGNCQNRQNTEKILEFVCPNFLYLHTLAIRSQNITDASLVSLSSASALKSLNLAGCSKITDTGLLLLSQFPSIHKLMTFVLYNSGDCEHRAPNVSDNGIMAIICRCTQLKQLSIGCTRLTDRTVLLIAQYLPSLTDLDIRGCQLIRDINLCLLLLSVKCPLLTSLNAYGSGTVNVPIIQILVHSLTSLTALSLQIQSTTGFSSSETRALVLSAHPTLKTLVLNDPFVFGNMQKEDVTENDEQGQYGKEDVIRLMQLAFPVI